MIQLPSGGFLRLVTGRARLMSDRWWITAHRGYGKALEWPVSDKWRSAHL